MTGDVAREVLNRAISDSKCRFNYIIHWPEVQTRRAELMLPALIPPPDPDPAPDPEPAVTLVDPLPDPYPPPFGLVGTLQNVAVISSSQITPVLGSDDVFVWPPAPSGCCCCAATGDVVQSSSAAIITFVISPLADNRQ